MGNRLSSERSPYLRHSAEQEINWYPWSEEAFEKARLEDKPVFLSSGAIWCHWCHVMAKESFENEEIARLLNEKFVSIKIDRDERPDLDRRYQMAVSAMGGGGGWPLSVFLTPEGNPFFGGTYFPPEDRFGRTGFKKILKTVADLYHSKKSEILKYSYELTRSLKPGSLSHGEITQSFIDEAVEKILSHFDPQNGGFGSSPKFPMSGVLEFLINRFFLSRKDSVGFAVRKTLESMAKGGFHDQIGGGFHRYSVDEAWIIPHFEKMTDDNAWLLRNYIDAYSIFGHKYFKETAEGIISFVRSTLSDPEGGFYASQDADVTPGDEGGYFTWTDEDFRKVLNDEEYQVLSLHLFNERGQMHHDESKRVLFIAMEEEEISRKLGMDRQKVNLIIQSGKEKLLKERNRRVAPFIDKTFYTSLNGMMITSYLRAFRVIKDDYIKDFALRSLKRMNEIHLMDNELFHTRGVKGFLDDHMYLIEASIASYEITGEHSYIDKADGLMNICMEKFWDDNESGFFDTEDEVLGIRLKSIEDIPRPSANALAVILLLKLHSMTGKEIYHNHAEKILKVFSGQAKDIGIHSGYYYCGMDAYFNMLTLRLHRALNNPLTDAALSNFRPYVIFLYGEETDKAIPCTKETCYEPIGSPEELKIFLSNLSR